MGAKLDNKSGNHATAGTHTSCECPKHRDAVRHKECGTIILEDHIGIADWHAFDLANDADRIVRCWVLSASIWPLKYVRRVSVLVVITGHAHFPATPDGFAKVKMYISDLIEHPVSCNKVQGFYYYQINSINNYPLNLVTSGTLRLQKRLLLAMLNDY